MRSLQGVEDGELITNKRERVGGESMYPNKNGTGSPETADGCSSTPRKDPPTVHDNRGRFLEEGLSGTDITALREFFEFVYSLQKSGTS
jgi:hypothetical protein